VRWRKFVERQGDYVEKWYTCIPLLFNKSHVKKYLRFSFNSPSYCQLWYFDLQHYVDFQVGANVSEKHNVFIFRAGGSSGL
jgi:hypothetical protein